MNINKKWIIMILRSLLFGAIILFFQLLIKGITNGHIFFITPTMLIVTGGEIINATSIFFSLAAVYLWLGGEIMESPQERIILINFAEINCEISVAIIIFSILWWFFTYVPIFGYVLPKADFMTWPLLIVGLILLIAALFGSFAVYDTARYNIEE